MSRRPFVFANLTILFAAIIMSTSFGASLVETALHMTRYFAAPPASFSTWYGDQTHTIAFWVPLQLGALVLSVIALIANWWSPARRRLLLVGLGAYVALIVWNIAYFAPEVRWLLRVAQGASMPSDFAARAHLWYVLTWVRQVVMAVPFFALMLTLIVPFGAGVGASKFCSAPRAMGSEPRLAEG
jgi:hypothetical protein